MTVPFALMSLAILVLGIGTLIVFPVSDFTQLLFSVFAMAMLIGVALFFKEKIAAFLNDVLNVPLDRYANRSI